MTNNFDNFPAGKLSKDKGRIKLTASMRVHELAVVRQKGRPALLSGVR
jgi:hypothetical protein